MKDGIPIIILLLVVIFFAFFAMDYSYKIYNEMVEIRQEMVVQKKALIIIANDIKFQNTIIEKQKEFIKTLEEDNKMLYHELFQANEKVRERAIKFQLYGDAKAQNAF